MRKVFLFIVCVCLIVFVGIKLFNNNNSDNFTYENNPAKETTLKSNNTYTVVANSEKLASGYYDVSEINSKELFLANENLNKKDVIRNQAFYNTNKIQTPKKSSVHLTPSKEKYLPLEKNGNVRLKNTYGNFFVPDSINGEYRFEIIGEGKVFCQIQDINENTGFINNVLEDFVFDTSTDIVKSLKQNTIISFFKKSGNKGLIISVTPIS
ncbi:hypothetical protein A5821_003183 [Enterococcus sp. 7F3_DIV0205]|uniref:Uncharacterized protein n=1 Tax=Candidatus Enterococcus palustris TaxID=1834189 RepID=A0AAQ3Y6C8_9ENTE|nr:hypothetical protein [Enterococcus sp. 7F3_DIV0205]OTN83616.1 hypothetical protein A5821_003540 [Enterococcus sp. 7F3_DIV0205]